MEQKIFLERYRSEFSNNKKSSLDVGLFGKTRLLPNDSISDTFSLYDQYNRERDECSKYRLILMVNPICSNVLFNMKTEVVLNEGSDKCCAILDGKGKSVKKAEVAKNAINSTAEITYGQAIKDTEYSHKDNGNFKYLCGYDIFNNHMLRNDGFVHVNQISKDNNGEMHKVYNTIGDYLRDGRGRIVEENINTKYDGNPSKLHLYSIDSILSMKNAFSRRCKEKDGWFGFTNPSNMEIPTNSGKTIMVNRMLANNKSCEFIDLYPGRELYSFVPQFNNERKRIEPNWDYCLTYPYSADTEMVDIICGGKYQAIRANIKKTVNTSSTPMLECSSYFKHNLNAGDYINVYFYTLMYNSGLTVCNETEAAEKYNKAVEEGTIIDLIDKDKCSFQKYSTKVRVMSTGDANGEHADKIFSIKYSDIAGIYDNLNFLGFFFKKTNGSSESEYYFRKFKKLGEYRSDINKVAFGENIYGDRTAQIVFTDDIDIDGLVDNNGRPLSEIYLTIVKRNKGHEEWYSGNTFNKANIEYSHCFGDVTSGIDFSGIDDEPYDYNVHYLHNINYSGITNPSILSTVSAWGETLLTHELPPKTVESGITIDMDEFYGDIVEMDTNSCEEIIIGNVYHRFNTAQRESWNEYYKDICEDRIDFDDYDNVNGVGSAFTVNTYCVNDILTVKTKKNGNSNGIMYGNIMPEGYFYNPHIRISVREDDDDTMQSFTKYINYTEPSLEQDDIHDIVKFTVPTNYKFINGDTIALYDKGNNKTLWGEIQSFDEETNVITLYLEKGSIGNVNYLDPQNVSRKFYAFWSPDSVPTYARFSMSSQKFIWRPLVAPSNMLMDDELYDLPFANGRFYIEKGVNFFLRRQDPNGKYGLSIPLWKKLTPVANPMARFVINGYEPMDIEGFLEDMNKKLNTCE